MQSLSWIGIWFLIRGAQDRVPQALPSLACLGLSKILHEPIRGQRGKIPGSLRHILIIR